MLQRIIFFIRKLFKKKREPIPIADILSAIELIGKSKTYETQNILNKLQDAINIEIEKRQKSKPINKSIR